MEGTRVNSVCTCVQQMYCKRSRQLALPISYSQPANLADYYWRACTTSQLRKLLLLLRLLVLPLLLLPLH